MCIGILFLFLAPELDWSPRTIVKRFNEASLLDSKSPLLYSADVIRQFYFKSFRSSFFPLRVFFYTRVYINPSVSLRVCTFSFYVEMLLPFIFCSLGVCTKQRRKILIGLILLHLRGFSSTRRQYIVPYKYIYVSMTLCYGNLTFCSCFILCKCFD